MVYKSYLAGILIRVGFIVLFTFLSIYFFLVQDSAAVSMLFFLLLSISVWNLISFTNITNKKITRFLESIRYSDFSSSFTKDSKLGKSFKEMNSSFNEVIDAFRKTRAEKEEQVLFLQIMIQHINTGIISFDSFGRIGVINGAAKQLLQIPQFKDIHDLGKLSVELLKKVLSLNPGGSFSLRINSEIHLNVQSAAFKMEGHNWTLLSFQNIKGELQKNELQAWQNLTKVLRHEIMNSMTPIASLADSLSTILKEDVQKVENGLVYLEEESFEDISEGLSTIGKRSFGLVDFVNAYRDYTNIPNPKLQKVKVQSILQDTLMLLKEDLAKDEVQIALEIKPNDLEIQADPELIQMVLINLIKNAKEALVNSEDKLIELKAGLSSGSIPVIHVIDHGEGIVPEALERIFVPFFTTKKSGSGIGLSISRQIMNLHSGSLEVSSTPGDKTVFSLIFG